MAPPAKKPIRVTFFWADEAAVVQDFQKKHSQKLVEWANEFFGRYGFELDVWPKPGGKVEEANRFCLSKTDGYELDLIGPEVLYEQVDKDRRLIVAAAKKIETSEYTPLRDEELAKKNEVGEILSQMGAASSLADMQPLLARMNARFEEIMALGAKLDEIRKRHEELKQFLDAINSKYKKRKQDLDFDLPVRSLIAFKVLQSIAFSVAGLRSADHGMIADPGRLKVLHCRFNLSPTVVTLTREPQPFAGTTPDSTTKQGLNFNKADGKPIWDGVFIMVNTNRHEQITLAHEIVHAAGRRHIDAEEAKKLKPASKWVTRIDPVTQQVETSIYDLDIDPGYYDGPPNDIINYNAKGKKPADVILQDSDKAALEQAFFVLPPKQNP